MFQEWLRTHDWITAVYRFTGPCRTDSTAQVAWKGCCNSSSSTKNRHCKICAMHEDNLWAARSQTHASLTISGLQWLSTDLGAACVILAKRGFRRSHVSATSLCHRFCFFPAHVHWDFSASRVQKVMTFLKVGDNHQVMENGVLGIASHQSLFGMLWFWSMMSEWIGELFCGAQNNSSFLHAMLWQRRLSRSTCSFIRKSSLLQSNASNFAQVNLKCWWTKFYTKGMLSLKKTLHNVSFGTKGTIAWHVCLVSKPAHTSWGLKFKLYKQDHRDFDF